MHVLAFIDGGYSRCRHCKGADCYSCDGVEGKCYRVYKESGYIVRVLGERRTVGGTAWYQLNHATVDMSKKRFHIATWFGRCGYRNLHVEPVKYKLRCSICNEEMGPLDYVGSKRFVVSRLSADFQRQSYEDYLEDGQPAWIVKESKA